MKYVNRSIKQPQYRQSSGNCVHSPYFFPHHSYVEDKKISGDKRSGSDMLGPKIGVRCLHF
jgi:hypothetical protein